MRSNTLATMLTGIALLHAGCENRDAGLGTRRSVLRAFQSCGELESYLEDAALDQIGRSYYWGWGRGFEGKPALGEPAQDTGAETDDAAPSAGGLTGTNVQEAGVDEADFVKSDAQFIYVLHGQNLVILDAFPAAETNIVSQTELSGWPSQMFIHGDLALVLADAPVEEVDPAGGAPVGWWTPRVLATVLDLGTDRTAPTVLRQSLIDGGLVGARLVGDSARLVTAHYTPIEVDWDVTVTEPAPVPPDCGWGEGGVDVSPPSTGTEGERRGGFSPTDCDAQWDRYNQEMADYQDAYIEALRDANRENIRNMTLADLLPQVETTIGADTTDGAVSECTSFYRTEVDSGYGLVSVHTIDLQHPTDTLDATTVVGDYGLIYASQDQLYLAMAQYPDWGPDWPGAGTVLQTTALHQFDIGSDAQSAPYIASGEVEGRLNNSFSLDEHGGYLRVATTVDRAAGGWDSNRDNTFSVLFPNDGLLETVGRIDGIAPDEQIYSARLFDDEGYLVTFRTIDPLFALDLRDPTSPRITGELEIPGFSQYMHPLGDDHLLTVGMEADENGVPLGLKLSIFDVSDAAAPALAHTEPLGAGYSEAQYEHKAFTFKATSEAGDEGILALPMSTWDELGGGGAELLVFDVSATDGFLSLGSVEHADLFTSPEEAYCYLRDVRRSVMSEDHVYSISYAGYKVNPLSDVSQTAAAGTFAQTDLCGYVEGGEGDTSVGGEPGGI